VNHVTCVGAGTIGSGWAAWFLAQGMDVTMTDPSPAAEALARANVDQSWPVLETLGLKDGADRDRLNFEPDLAKAVADAEFIQESAPDREQLKIDLFAEIDAAAPADTVIASSSSAFLPSRIQSKCKHPERVIIGHPFVPSYLVPLVEVVGGDKTSQEVMDWGYDFYMAAGKQAMKLKKEIESYVANRIQHVVFQEASSLVSQGICDYEDIDTAVAYGPGMRWAFAGPVMCYHLGGGKGGIRHMIDHFGWTGEEADKERLIAAVDKMVGDASVEELERWRDANLLTMLKGFRTRPGSD
jgi:carnitine 3-dehydrogenase